MKIFSRYYPHQTRDTPWDNTNKSLSLSLIHVNDVIADKNAVTKIINNSTGLQRTELNGFSKRHWQTGYYPFVYGWCLGL